jgi:hypothetical protein
MKTIHMGKTRQAELLSAPDQLRVSQSSAAAQIRERGKMPAAE